MSIEPINSIMSLQQQTYTPAQKPVQPVSSAEISQQPDSAATPLEDIAVIGAPTEKGNSDTSEEQGNSDDGQQLTSDQIKKAVEKLKKGQLENSEAVFGFHEETNRVTIKIVDKKTKEVIKELPPEKTLDMIAKVWEMAGLFVNEKR